MGYLSGYLWTCLKTQTFSLGSVENLCVCVALLALVLWKNVCLWGILALDVWKVCVCVCMCVCKTFKKFQPPIFKVLKLRVGSGRPVAYLEAVNSFRSEVISTYLKSVKSVIMLKHDLIFRPLEKHKISIKAVTVLKVFL